MTPPDFTVHLHTAGYCLAELCSWRPVDLWKLAKKWQSVQRLHFFVAGYMDIPASLPEDRSLLIELFGLCLAGDAALHTRLVDALLDLSAVEAECRVVGTAASLGPEQPPLANVVAEAICGIKLQECQELSAIQCPPDCRDQDRH